MSYKLFIYVISVMLSTYALTGINWNKLLKTDKKIEARILIIVLGIGLGYLVSNFIISFIEVTRII